MGCERTRSTESTNQPGARNRSAAADLYRVHVRGHLDDGWSDWFGGFAMERHDDGTTVLVGPVVDQAALHGLLARIRDLSLAILSVSQTGGAVGGPALGDRGGGGLPP